MVYALIDSGADISVIPKDLAEVLDLDLSGEKEISYGIGGKIEVKTTKMEILLKKGRDEYRFVIPVQVVLTGEEPPIILGRKVFFEKFIISFDEARKKIKIKSNKSILRPY